MSNKTKITKLPLREKIGYALGDGAANIAWRGVATFLFVFYTDVFGLSPAIVGVLFFVTRLCDGISDILMGIVCDRTTSKYGKFRPWILWTAIPLGVVLSLLFTGPDLNENGKIAYAYVTYILFALIYTANNIPYGALMSVMTDDDKERTSLGSFRMVGAFTGGMLVQGLLLFLVAYFGSVNADITVNKLEEDKFKVTITALDNVSNVNIKTKGGVAVFTWQTTKDSLLQEEAPSHGKSFAMKTGEKYTFIVTGDPNIRKEYISIINQNTGYSKSIYVLSFLLIFLMLCTFYTTKERVLPPKNQESNLTKDFKDLLANKPWLVLLVVGLMFSIYNSIKQGITIIYFTHYLHNQLLAASFLISLMLASIAGAMATAPLSKKLGKKKLFIYALLLAGFFGALVFFCGPNDIIVIFILGIISEFFTAMFPTLFFTMLGDAADYSEYKNERRATGLIYSAGSFASKFGGGIAAGIIGFVLTLYNYDGQNLTTISGAIPGIIMLMSWIPAIVTIIAAGMMFLYPLDQNIMDEIILTLKGRRKKA